MWNPRNGDEGEGEAEKVTGNGMNLFWGPDVDRGNDPSQLAHLIAYILQLNGTNGTVLIYKDLYYRSYIYL